MNSFACPFAGHLNVSMTIPNSGRVGVTAINQVFPVMFICFNKLRKEREGASGGGGRRGQWNPIFKALAGHKTVAS